MEAKDCFRGITLGSCDLRKEHGEVFGGLCFACSARARAKTALHGMERQRGDGAKYGVQ